MLSLPCHLSVRTLPVLLGLLNELKKSLTRAYDDPWPGLSLFGCLLLTLLLLNELK
jgi:hypothetical protein